MDAVYTLTLPNITIKKHVEVDGEVKTLAFAELGGDTYDNLDYGAVVAIEKILLKAGDDLLAVAEAHHAKKARQPKARK
jgi:hypothetical protein